MDCDVQGEVEGEVQGEMVKWRVKLRAKGLQVEPTGTLVHTVKNDSIFILAHSDNCDVFP